MGTCWLPRRPAEAQRRKSDTWAATPRRQAWSNDALSFRTSWATTWRTPWRACRPTPWSATRHWCNSTHISSNSPPASAKGAIWLTWLPTRWNQPSGLHARDSNHDHLQTRNWNVCSRRLLTETDNHFHCESCLATVARTVYSWLQRGPCPATLDAHVPIAFALPADMSHAYAHPSPPSPVQGRQTSHGRHPERSQTALTTREKAPQGTARTPSTRRTGGPFVSRHAAVAALLQFLLQFFGPLAGEENMWLPPFEMGSHYRMGPSYCRYAASTQFANSLLHAYSGLRWLRSRTGR